MAEGSNLKVDGQRLMDAIFEMAKIGATAKGGCNRQTLTDLDREGRDLFKRWCEAAGLTVTIDELGNMFARRKGKRDDLPAVALGSHLDTQPTGGKYDGVAGVLSGLEVVRTLNDAGIETDHPIVVVNWTNEEGTRFAPAMLCSGAYAGAFSKEWVRSRTDAEGRTFGEEIERIGYKGDKPLEKQDWKCHLELHIEQGPILEMEEKVIGVVAAGQGLRWYNIAIEGRESHAGSTPMPRRKDALVAASKVIARLDEIAREHGPSGVATVGVVNARPQSRNIIPGHVDFTVDLRHPNDDDLKTMGDKLRAAVAEACARDGLENEIDEFWYFPPVTFDEQCVSAVREATQALGYPWREMVSGAGHDSFFTARLHPTSMIFIPCRDGLSHNEEEHAEPEHIEAGANVLLHAALRMASGGN